jgi:hypothetical protein
MDPVTTIVMGLVLQVGRPGGGFPPPNTGGGGEDAALAMIQIFVELLFAIPALIGMWGVFAKAGKPGWAAIVPIYNIIVLLEITEKPT